MNEERKHKNNTYKMKKERKKERKYVNGKRKKKQKMVKIKNKNRFQQKEALRDAKKVKTNFVTLNVVPFHYISLIF